jgi:diguanylate cyclase (GGDEF)-like protein
LDIPSFFSIAFIAACVICLFVGIYTLQLNPRSKTNVLFFVMSLTLALWALGLGMAVSADRLVTALFWRRFSALGWGAFFSVLLHFFHVFIGKNTTSRKIWFYILLYLPTAVTYLGFTYFPVLNPGQYNLVSTPLGWVNIAANNAWDMFYLIYYLLYAAAGFCHIWLWGRRNGSPRIKKQARIISIALFITMLIGTLTDILGNLIFSAVIPQLAPIYLLLPIAVIYYCIRKYGLLNPKHVDEETILMSDQIRTKITNYLANSFVFAALLNVIVSYLLMDKAETGDVLLFSGILILIGIVLRVIERFVIRKGLKDILNAIAYSLIVPLLTLRFIDYAGTTVWAYPMILLIVTLVLGRRFVQIMLSVSILLTLAAVWLMMPEVTVSINSADHAVRIGIFIIAIWFAWFGRRVFRSKLQENAEQIGSQKIITEISTEFISVNDGNLDVKIDSALSKLGDFLIPDRLYVYIYDDKKEILSRRSIWFSQEKMTDAAIEADLSADNYPLLMRRLGSGNPIVLSDVSDVSGETGGELPRLLGSVHKSFAAMPIIIRNEVYGFFGVDAEPKSKNWPETQLAFFRIISNILADAFERIHQEIEITEMAFYDYLTKLPNRILFRDRAAQAISLAERTGTTIAVVFLDLDAFKAVNDTIGHDGGDRLLLKAAEGLKKCLRKSDTVARFGGDEFLILLNNLTSTEDIPKIVEKITYVFDKPFIIDEQEFFVTASAGIAVYPYDGTDSEALVKNADLAMCRSKEQGKNRYLFCTEDMKEEILRKLKLTGNLFRALERHELKLYYQPQVSTKSKKIIGAEALLRWFHPEFGIVSPSLFIPLAEQTGLIGPIGDWVLMTACLQCRTWHLKGLPDIRVAVNVSVHQLRNPEFVYRVGQILEETQLEPQYLELEVTESAAVSESDYIIEVLDNLKKLGVSISIDDFGTEYSSLSRLSAMPIDRIKLDMHFIRNIGRSEKENAIIMGIIGLAHTLGLKVVAEGVETERQLDFLTERSSDEIQGFFFYRPLPPEELEGVLSAGE